MKQCVTSFARCMLWRYVQPYLTKQCAHPDIYITVWGSIDTHRYIYILYIIIIFISMPFYRGIDINIFIRVCARRARVKHPTV